MKHFKLIRPLLLAFLSLTAFQSGRADHVRNGGGAAELNFAIALNTLEATLDIALSSSSGNFDSEERSLLRAILKTLPSELQNKSLLEFHSEMQEPGFFQLDGAVRVAKTGSEVGSTIYINRDLIYYLRSNQWVAMTLLECIPILIHELGHHHGDIPHTDLDLLGVKVQALLSKNYSISEFDPTLTVMGDDITDIKEFPVASAFELSKDTSKRFDSRLYFSDSFGTYDITSNLMAGIKAVGDQEGGGANRLSGSSCWGSTFESSERKGWKFSQYHASAARWTYATTIQPGMYLFYLKATLSIECVNMHGDRMVDPGLDVLQLAFLTTEDGKSRFMFLDSPELYSAATLINDDDDYKVSAVTGAILKARFNRQ